MTELRLVVHLLVLYLMQERFILLVFLVYLYLLSVFDIVSILQDEVVEPLTMVESPVVGHSGVIFLPC